MEINSKLNMKIIKKVKSHGANSSLYLIEDTQLNQVFMLKQIDKTKIKESSKYFDEVRKVKSLENKNIVKVNYAVYDDDNIYICMPYYKNGSLQDILQRRNLTVREIVKYSLEILSGLYYIHQKNMLHCDVKPSNILIDNRGVAVLADFGSSINVGDDGYGKLKSVYYKHIAPEQCYNSKIDKGVDIYQFGNTLYRMCNGEEEYNKQVKKSKTIAKLKEEIVNGNFPIRKKYYPHIPKKLIKITEKCLNLDKNQRYQDVLEILNDMSRVDLNLDWRYEKQGENYRWIKQDEKYTGDEDKKFIQMSKKDINWQVKGRIYEEFELEFEHIADGFKCIRKLIKETN